MTMKGILRLIADVIYLSNITDDDTLHHITFKDQKKKKVFVYIRWTCSDFTLSLKKKSFY